MPITNLIPWKRGDKSPVKQENLALPTLQNEMNRLFDDFFSSWPAPLGMFGEWETFSPKMNIVENDKNIQVSAELPGMGEEDIEVTLAQDTLTISGEKKQDREEKGANYHRVERSYGSFRRVIALPGNVEQDKIEAMFKNGVLTITLPKTAEAQIQKRVEIKTQA